MDRLAGCLLPAASGGWWHLAYIPAHNLGASVFVQNYVTESQLETYTEKYFDLDWQRQQMEHLPVGGAMASSQLSRDRMRDYFDGQYFQEFSRDTPQYMSLGGQFVRDSEFLGTTGFHRRSLDDPFLPGDIVFTQRLHGHLARVLAQAHHVALLHDAAEFAGSRNGLLLLDRHGKVVYQNAAATTMLRAGGLLLSEGVLSAEKHRDNVRLRNAVALALTPLPIGAPA